MPLSSSDPVVAAYSTAVARRGTAPSSSATARTVFSTSPYSTGDQIQAGVTRTGQSGGVSNVPEGAPQPTSGGGAGNAGEWTFQGITDPSWQAVARGFQFNADTINTNANLRREQIQARADYQRPQIQYEGEIARRDTSYDAEGRGILRSGEHERMLAEQMRKEQQRLADLDLQTSGQLTEVGIDTSNQLADLRRQFAEKGQDAAYQQYVQEGIQQAQQTALGQPTAAQPAAGNKGGLSLAQNADGSVANGGLYFDGWAYYTIDRGVIRHIGDPATVQQMMAAGVSPTQVRADQVNYYRQAAGLI